jgi:hypothetical protein
MSNQIYELLYPVYTSESDNAKINKLVRDKMTVHPPIQGVSFIEGVMTWAFYGKVYTGKTEDDIKNFLDEYTDGDETHLNIASNPYRRYLTFEGKVKQALMSHFKTQYLPVNFPKWEKVLWSDGTSTMVKNGYDWNHFACCLRDICKR